MKSVRWPPRYLVRFLVLRTFPAAAAVLIAGCTSRQANPPPDCTVTTTRAPADPTEAVRWGDPEFLAPRDVRCHEASATASGNTVTVGFNDFRIEYLSGQRATRGRKRLRMSVPYQVLNAERVGRCRVSMRGSVDGAPAARAVLWARSGDSQPHRQEFRPTDADTNTEMFLEFEIPLTGGAESGTFPLELELSVTRPDRADQVIAALDSVDLSVGLVGPSRRGNSTETNAQ